MNKKSGGFWKTGGLALALASSAALLAVGAARADTLVIGNQAAFGGGLIETVNATTHVFVNSFVPDGASGTNTFSGPLSVTQGTLAVQGSAAVLPPCPARGTMAWAHLRSTARSARGKSRDTDIP